MRNVTWILAACTLVWAQAASPASIIIENNIFRLTDVSRLAHLSAADYQKIFKVGVDAPDFSAMAGSYRLDGDSLTFVPAFPLTPGLAYRAEFIWGPEMATARTTIPNRSVAPTTSVARIIPTTTAVPENLLKIYIQFTAPMSRGDAYRHVHLIDQDGEEVNSVFLQIGQELWDPQQTRLTLLFDPGRIKRGLVSQTQLGMALKAGRTYRLIVDRDWPDANGVPLKAEFEKTYAVGPADRMALDAARWSVSSPRVGSRQALTVDFHEPLDEVLLQDLLTVKDSKGQTVAGRIAVLSNGSRWIFTPTEVWMEAKYELSVPSILEDLAGNKINSPFDVDVATNPGQRMTFRTYAIDIVPH